MTIERLHFEKKFEMKFGELTDEQVEKIFADNKDNVQILHEGECDLTPNLNSSMKHTLKVLENGNGIYKAGPRSEKVKVTGISSREHNPEWYIILLRQSTDRVVINSRIKGAEVASIHEIIRYVSGPSPKKQTEILP
jgi:hypothetical protein